MTNAEKLKEVLNNYYILAVRSESESTFNSFYDMANGVQLFALEIGFVSCDEWAEIWNEFRNRFLKICEDDFRELEKEKYKIEPLTQDEIKKRNKMLKEILKNME